MNKKEKFILLAKCKGFEKEGFFDLFCSAFDLDLFLPNLVEKSSPEWKNASHLYRGYSASKTRYKKYVQELAHGALQRHTRLASFGKGIYFATSKNVAKYYTKARFPFSQNLLSVKLKPDAKLAPRRMVGMLYGSLKPQVIERICNQFPTFSGEDAEYVYQFVLQNCSNAEKCVLLGFDGIVSQYYKPSLGRIVLILNRNCLLMDKQKTPEEEPDK